MKLEDFDRALEFKTEIDLLRGYYKDLDYMKHYSAPFEFTFKGVLGFFRKRIIPDSAAIHYVSEFEAIMLKEYLQDYRANRIAFLEAAINNIGVEDADQ